MSVVRFVQEQFAPIEFVDGLAEFFGRHAGGVEAADEAAHAGAGDEVDGDAVAFEPFDDADVAESEGPAAFQYQADFRAVVLGLGC